MARLDDRIKLLQQSDVATVQINPQAGNEVIKHDIADREAIGDIALIAGDWVHNLKCALDYCWIEVLTKFAPQALGNRAKFPVFPTKDALEAALRSIAIDQASSRLFDVMIGEIQPYERGNYAIWPVHRLDIRDKHRLLIPTILYTSISDIETQDQTGEISPNGFTPGTHQQPPWYIPMPVGVHVKNEGKVSLSISLQYGESENEIIFADTLNMYSQAILAVVQVLEAIL